MIPCSGGSVEFARRAFGATVGYLVAMVTILSGYFLSLAVVALLMAQYIDNLFDADLPQHAIAATAIVHGLTVVTRNVRDFQPFSVPTLNPCQVSR